MARRIVLLLGSMLLFSSTILVQEKEKTPVPVRAGIKIKTIGWFARPGDMVIVPEVGEQYVLHLHLPFPFMSRGEGEDESQPVFFPYAYEAVLQRRFIAMLSHKIAFSTNKYDRDQGQKEDRPKYLEMFFWDASKDNLSVEITPGVFKNGVIFPLDEKLEYSFDLKSGEVSEGLLFPRLKLDDDDAEMIKNFLAFLAVYVGENIEWYEVETRKKQKNPLPENKEEKNKNATTPLISGVFLSR